MAYIEISKKDFSSVLVKTTEIQYIEESNEGGIIVHTPFGTFDGINPYKDIKEKFDVI